MAGKDKTQRLALDAEQRTVVAEAQREGIARAGGSHTPGINGLSAPVFDYTGQMVAAITAVGTAGQFDADCHSAEAQKVKAAAQRLSELLGHGSVGAAP